MSYFVYTPREGGQAYPHNWRHVETFPTYEEALDRARTMCGSPLICTEPGNGLPEGFLGNHGSTKWRAMITQADIFNGS